MQTKNLRRKLYELNSKIIYQTNQEHKLIQFFQDNITVADDKIQILGKGIVNNSISALLMERMNHSGLATHFIEKINMREQLIHRLDLSPIRIQVSNIAYGKYVKAFDIEEGYVFKQPLLDFYLENSWINEQQIVGLGALDEEDLVSLKNQSYRVNDFFRGVLAGAKLRLVSCKLIFGHRIDGEEEGWVLADELSPDNCCIWDLYSNTKMDHEYAISTPDKAISMYQEVAKRLK